MARYSSSRFARGALLAAVLPLGAALFLSACAGADTTRDGAPVAPVGAGDLTGLDVDIHQAVD